MSKPSFLSAIRKATKGDEVWDKGERESVSGLHVRALSDDHKVFMFYYRPKDRAVVTVLEDGSKKRKYPQRRLSIGDFGPITVGAAREQASLWAARVRLGEDPKADRDGTRDQLTVAQVYEKAIEDSAQGWNTPACIKSGWKKEVEWNWGKHLEKTFGGLKLGEVTTGKVRTWHANFKKTGTVYAGNRTRSVLSRIFNYAIELELFEGRNPCAGVDKHPERKRKRFATLPEIRKLGEIFRRESATYPREVAFLMTMAYSAARPVSLERAEWAQLQRFDVAGREFGRLVFEGKTTGETGDEETVVIPPQAMQLLDALPRTSDGLVFGIELPRARWAAWRTEAGCPDLWARDWRRTWASVGRSKAKFSMDELAPALNHRYTGTTAIYAQAFPDDVVEMVSKVADAMDLAFGAPPEK